MVDTNTPEPDQEQKAEAEPSNVKTSKVNLKLLIKVFTPIILVTFLVLFGLYYFLGEDDFYALFIFKNDTQAFNEENTLNLVEIPSFSTRVQTSSPTSHIIKISMFLDLQNTFVTGNSYISGCTDDVNNTPASKATTFEDCVPFIITTLKKMFAGIHTKNIYKPNSLIPIKEKITKIIAKIIYPLQIRSVFIRLFTYSG